MKKKNIIKKLLSVILSAATVFSLLTLPAHAIVPGEGAYTTTTTLIRQNWETGETEQLIVSNYDMYPGTSTYSFLSSEELARCTNISDNMVPQVIIGDDDRFNFYPVDLFSSIVLIVQTFDSDGDNLYDEISVGTGYLVSENVMITAMHCLFPRESGVENDLEDANYITTYVYQGESTLCSNQELPLLSLDYDNSAQITSITYDPRFFNVLETSGYSSTYDWCIVTLDKNFSCMYMDCDIALPSLEEEDFILAGYPRGMDDALLFQLFMGQGKILDFDGTIFTHDADAEGGQSGGPLFTNAITNDFTCYGLHLSGSKSPITGLGIENYARAITPEIYNAIVEIMLDS